MLLRLPVHESLTILEQFVIAVLGQDAISAWPPVLQTAF